MSLERAIRGVLTKQIAPKEITEAKDPNEYDKEGDMMKSQLRQIDSAIDKLMGMVNDDDNLPEWVQSKMTKATDYIRSVRDYLESEKMNEEWVCGKCNCDPCTCEGNDLEEKTLTPAELKKREEIAKAIERENPDMPMPQKMAIATAQAKKVAEATVNTADIEKHKNISQSDKDKIAKIADMMSKEKKPKTEAYKEPQGQAKSMMSPLHKARIDKEKADRDRDGKLKPGVVKVKKEEVEVEEAKKVSSMQIHKVLAPTKNSREGIAALKKAFRVNDREAQMMLKKVMNEETIDEISRSMTPMSKRFGKAVDPKKFDAYKKHVKQHGVDEPTVRFIDDNPNHNQSKRAMQDKHVAQAVKLYKAAHKESVDEVLDTPDRAMNYKHRAKYSRDRARNSQAAHMMRGTDPSKDKDTERKRERGLKTLNRNIAGKIRKSMMNKEEVQEAKKPDETVNIRQSLKKAIDMRGQKEVVFKDGSKAKISVQDAEKAMKMLDNTRMAKAKQDLTIRMMKSHQDFKDTLAGKKPKVDPFALRVRKEDNNPKIVRHLELAKKARAEGDYDKANYHTQLARQMQNEGTFISKFKEEIKEKKRMSETKGAPKGYHFTRSGQLKKGDAGQDGDGGKMLRSDPLDKQRNKIPPLPENDK